MTSRPAYRPIGPPPVPPRPFVLVLVLVLAPGCTAQEPDPIAGVPDFGANAEEPEDGLDPEPLAFAVVSSDRTITSVALLEPDGELLRRGFVHSGNATAGLVTALSGDVVVPTRSGDPQTLTLIDRFRADVVTRVDVERGEVLGQLRTQKREPGESAYSSNPQDLVILDEHEAWLSRYNPNVHVEPNDDEAGNDLIAIDPSSLVRTGERIDFSALDTTAERENPDSGEREEVRAYARPARIVALSPGASSGRKLLIGLSRISRSFDAVGDGAVALVDMDTRSVQAVPLEGLRNCSQVAPVPDDASRAIVACTGPLAKGSEREHAGLALLALDGDELTVEYTWRASDDEESAVAVFGVVALGGSVVVAVAPGDEGEERPDQLYRVDLADGSQDLLLETDAPWVLGDGAYNPRARRLFIPDATTDDDERPTGGVHRFTVDDELQPEALDVVRVEPSLPPWQVAPL